MRKRAPMRAEMLKNLPQTFGNRALHQFDEKKAAIVIGPPDVLAQCPRVSEGLRPLGIVDIDLAPGRRKKNWYGVRARGRPPAVRSAVTAMVQVADEIRQAAIEEAAAVADAVRQLRAHTLGAFLRERP